MARLPTIDYRPLILFLTFILLTSTSCANVVNYTDPAGPRFAVQAHPADQRSALKVVTFNIRYAREIDSAIVVLMQDPALHDADVIALQEMD
jgi:hypothetical protein